MNRQQEEKTMTKASLPRGLTMADPISRLPWDDREFRGLLRRARWLKAQGCTSLRDAGDVRKTVLAWQDDHGDEAPFGLAIYCGCDACGCDELATTTDEGIPVCAECAVTASSDTGEVVCLRCPDTEIVHDGGHSYLRISPPPMPEEDPEGEFALYWDTVGDDSGVVARFATREEAEQAAAAKDWPGPTDHTRYLCGYTVRVLVDGEWANPSEEDY